MDGPTDGRTDRQTKRVVESRSTRLKMAKGVLDASSHLYMRVCPSVRPSVGPSVRRAVTPSQNEPFVRKKFKIPSSAHQRTLSASIPKQKATKKSRWKNSRAILNARLYAQRYMYNTEDASLAYWACFSVKQSQCMRHENIMATSQRCMCKTISSRLHTHSINQTLLVFCTGDKKWTLG